VNAPVLTGKRILVAEDDPVFRRVIVFTLQKAGFEVTPCADGQEAWKFLQEHSFDCLVVDHQMPRLCGLELAARVRQEPSRRGLPIILCTAKRLELDIDFFIEQLQIAAILMKPFRPSQLVQVVAEACHAPGLRHCGVHA